jgi:uncharacterized membrane protein YfcA
VSIAAMVLLSFTAGVAVSVVTAPVGVSGAVFLLPIQLSVLEVPNPAVTPTNLLFNIVAIPGALARYRQRAPLSSPLTRVLLAGTLPGVVVGADIRVFLIPGSEVFRVFVATLLFPLGVWLCLRSSRPCRPVRSISTVEPFHRSARARRGRCRRYLRHRWRVAA